MLTNLGRKFNLLLEALLGIITAVYRPMVIQFVYSTYDVSNKYLNIF